MTQSNTPISFKVFQGDTFLREEVLSQSVIKIGNLVSSHLRLDDQSVSRMHAVVEQNGDRVSIIDLGSTAGTLVNGNKVNKAVLNNGDTLTIGELRLVVTFSVLATTVTNTAPSSQPPPLPGNSNVLAAAAVHPPTFAQAPAAPSSFAVSPPLSEQTVGEQSIEVTALLGDSVVGVKHVMNPLGGKVTPLTYALMGLGAVFLLVSAIGFGSGFSNAADNKARLHEHMQSKKVAHEFRPSRLGAAFDWMALGGLGGGLLCMTFGLLRAREEKVLPSFRIGNAKGVDFPTEDAPVPDFSLVAAQGDRFVLNFAKSWQGETQRGGQSRSLADAISHGSARSSSTLAGAMEMDIQPGEEIRVNTGAQQFLVRSVVKPRRQAVPLLAAMDTNALGYVAGTAMVVGAFMLILNSLHADEKRLYGDLFENTDRFSLVSTTPFEDAIAEELAKEEVESDPGGTGTQMSEAEGLMGDKESIRPDGQFAIKKTNDAEPTIAREQALSSAREAGILGILKSSEGGPFAQMNAMANFTTGLDDRDVYGGLLGSEVAAAAGGWGFGTKGMGPGGGCIGCENWGTIGTGNYNTIGHSDGTGSKFAAGGGNGGMRGHKASQPILKIGPTKSGGGLDADIIRRHIKRKLSRIRHCYEKELLVHPDLDGTVTTAFQISPLGKVQGMSSQGMGNKEVESCVGEALMTIQFPKPLDGGYVNVTRYPFTFRPAGG